MKLGGTVPPNKTQLGGTVPPNKTQLGGTVAFQQKKKVPGEIFENVQKTVKIGFVQKKTKAPKFWHGKNLKVYIIGLKVAS